MLSFMRWSLPLLVIVLQCACVAPDEDADPQYGDPLPPMGNVLIEELFYAGSPPAAGSDHYNADQFIEIYS